MYASVSEELARWLRLPRDAPVLPTGGGRVIEGFPPASAFLGYLRFRFWMAALPVVVALLAGWIALWTESWIHGLAFLPLALAGAAGAALVHFSLRLRYDTTWYVLTDRSVRIRRGVWTIREATVTFENVQNVSVRQGPIQRHFGIANVSLDTAGAGKAAGEGEERRGSRAVIEGIAEPERIRALILARVRTSRFAGLGDEVPSATAAAVGQWTGAHVELLREIREAVAGLGSGPDPRAMEGETGA